MRLHIVAMVGNLITPGLSAMMMGRMGSWPVMYVSVASSAISVLGTRFLPETKPKTVEEDGEASLAGGRGSASTGAAATWRHFAAMAKESVAMIKSRSLVLVLAASLVSIALVYSTMQFLAQFSSKRYGLPLSETGYLLSVGGFGNLITIVFVMPAVAVWLRADSTPKPFRQADDRSRDLMLAKLSGASAIVGGLCMAAAPTIPTFIGGMVILSLASGFSSILRSLVVVYVDVTQRTRAFTIFMISETIGSGYAHPMLAGLFSLGMRYGGIWIGLPYFGVAVGCVLAVGFLMFVRMPQQPLDEGHESGGEVEDDGWP